MYRTGVRGTANKGARGSQHLVGTLLHLGVGVDCDNNNE